MDIKNSMEALEAMKQAGVVAKKIFKDGKINAEDLALLPELASASPALLAAIEGIGEIPAEVKELSEDEAKQLVAKIFEVFSAIKAA